MEDFRRDYLKDFTPEERLEVLSPKATLDALTPEMMEALRKLLQSADKASKHPA
jgi:hypothetical protein